MGKPAGDNIHFQNFFKAHQGKVPQRSITKGPECLKIGRYHHPVERRIECRIDKGFLPFFPFGKELASRTFKHLLDLLHIHSGALGSVIDIHANGEDEFSVIMMHRATFMEKIESEEAIFIFRECARNSSSVQVKYPPSSSGVTSASMLA